VTELDSQIQSELGRLHPLPSGERADWDDVVHRAGGRSKDRWSGRWRFLALAAVVVLLMAATGTAVGLGFDFMAEQDRVDRQLGAVVGESPTGDRVEIAGGRSWSFMAWPAGEDICVAYAAEAATNWARSCGSRPSEQDDPAAPDSLIATLLTPGENGAIVGAVTSEVARIELQLDDGRSLYVATEPAPASFGADVRLFLIRAELDAPPNPVRAYVSYDTDGKVLERYPAD